MTLSPEAKAARATTLLQDEVLQEVITELRADAGRTVFSNASSDEDVQAARHMVWALEKLAARLQSLVDDATIERRRATKGRTV